MRSVARSLRRRHVPLHRAPVHLGRRVVELAFERDRGDVRRSAARGPDERPLGADVRRLDAFIHDAAVAR